MIRFNRIVLALRLVLFFFLLTLLFISISQMYDALIDENEFPDLFLIASLYLGLTVFRLRRLITHESVDIIIEEDKIILKNRFTKIETIIDKSHIVGYQIQKYTLELFKISGIKSIWEFESEMLVLYSDFKAIAHFKSITYWDISGMIELLETNNYRKTNKRKRFFDIYNYRPI